MIDGADVTGGEGAPGCASLTDPERLIALAEAGLSADSDPEMEWFATEVCRALDVPVSLVSLVESDQQVFPGMAGLPEPWASKRATPLTHSFCKHVVMTAEPLIVQDAREHATVADNLAVAEMGVVAYAGMPLTDTNGMVLGSLAAVDVEPRHWTTAELRRLAAIARTCSTELRLRLALFDAERERERRDGLEATLRRSFDRSQRLLTASRAFSDTESVADVRAQVKVLLADELAPRYIGIALLERPGRLRRLPDPDFPALSGAEWSASYNLAGPMPSARAAREQRIIHYPDRRRFDADNPPEAQRLLRELGLHAIVAVPMPGDHGPVGAMLIGWGAPRTVEHTDLLTISTIADYAARALGRAELLQHRTTVADQLQRAMLTTLPVVDGLDMAARYQAADHREHVGGDWYDAAPVPLTGGRDELALAVSVGDIVGHTLEASTIMGQVRSMLRQAAWDHPGSPSSTFAALERATTGLGLKAAGTAVLAHLERSAQAWTLTWSNAGHPPPILIRPDGAVDLLERHDSLLGFPGVQTGPRRDHRVVVDAGSTLFLYTDGLVERRGCYIDTRIGQLVELLGQARHRPARKLVNLAVETLAPDAEDDVVAFAIRFLDDD